MFKLFGPKKPEDHARRADAFFERGQWGKAKLAYERALELLENAASEHPRLRLSLEDKLTRAKETLAAEHLQNATDLIEGGYGDDARELLELALSLTNQSALVARIEDKLTEIEAAESPPTVTYEPIAATPEPAWLPDDDDEEFAVLCASLPEDIQILYESYGDDFKDGYLALNRADFETAADCLQRALTANPDPDTYIRLELATALVHLQRFEDARQLLEPFAARNRQVLPAYQLLCEIYWQQGAFAQADALLADLPQDLTESLAVYILKGETLLRSGNHEDAKQWYQNFIDNYGYNEAIVRALATTLEVLQEWEAARMAYRQIIDHCQSCHSRLDPQVKLRYADLSTATGNITGDILEIYLALAQELPAQAADCYEKVSRIYADNGHPGEARRFAAIARQARALESADQTS